ncbi:MAG: cytochrome C [Epsilonproteobacteria bacterium]|nr:MAG: cytochrome C [Campylobacterota bacterium]
MNKIVKIALGATLLLSLGATTVSADVAKGQKLYTKKLKGDCGITGAAAAGKHTQDEWSEIGTAGMAAEIKNLCPSVKDKALKGKYLPHYLDFFKEYGSDSGNVPSC